MSDKDISKRLLDKINRVGVEVVLADVQDVMSALLLDPTDEAYKLLRQEAIRQHRKKTREKEAAKKRKEAQEAEEAQEARRRPTHVPIGKGASMVVWEEQKPRRRSSP